MGIDYDHARNLHGVSGPRAALPIVLRHTGMRSLLDVGCGTGTWLAAALELGVSEVMGLDGVSVSPQKLLFPSEHFVVQDLEQPWRLGRRFDAVFCLEVAEHLAPSGAESLIKTLAVHADTIVFSAACPRQPGQHHVNCRWPDYWQGLFNAHGLTCCDAIRWEMWDDCRIEPWYRQNMFIGRRNAGGAGSEPRLKPVVHPGILDHMVAHAQSLTSRGIERGGRDFLWYLKSAFRRIRVKARRAATRQAGDMASL